MRRSVVLALTASALVWPAAGRQRPTASTVIDLKRWVRAVDEHGPGRKDAAVDAVSGWSPAVRKTLGGGIWLFLGALTGNGRVVTPDEERAIVDLGVTEGQIVGPGVFLKRAAVLEADAVMFTALSTSRPSTEPGAAIASPGPPSPLFPTTALVLANDGVTSGMVTADWHWTFARSLLDLVHSQPVGDAFVAEWYHATTAYLLRSRSWGEARGQLDRATVLFPDDARILLDRACLSEVMGLPESQRLLTAEDLAAMRIQSVPGQRVLPNAPRISPNAAHMGIPPKEVADAEAERLFLQAVKVDPHLDEARVRIARLFEGRGKYKEAAVELDTAFGSAALAGDPVLSYYGHLFMARAQRALGKPDAAVAHVLSARRLFPQAQSAMIAESDLALQSRDPTAAISALRRLVDLPSDPSQRSDPWWQYDQGPGRHADALLTAMWTHARTIGK